MKKNKPYRVRFAVLARALSKEIRQGVLDTLRQGESIRNIAGTYGITVEEVIGIMDISVARDVSVKTQQTIGE